MKNEMNDKILTIYLGGHIDSANSASTEKEVFDIIDSCEPESVIIDAEEAERAVSAVHKAFIPND